MVIITIWGMTSRFFIGDRSVSRSLRVSVLPSLFLVNRGFLFTILCVARFSFTVSGFKVLGFLFYCCGLFLAFFDCCFVVVVFVLLICTAFFGCRCFCASRFLCHCFVLCCFWVAVLWASLFSLVVVLSFAIFVVVLFTSLFRRITIMGMCVFEGDSTARTGILIGTSGLSFGLV